MGKENAKSRYKAKCHRVELTFSPKSQTYEALIKYAADNGLTVAGYVKDLVEQDLFRKYYLDQIDQEDKG